MAHNAIRRNDARLAPLKAHFEYMMNLGEVRATRVVATLVDGVAGHSNRDDAEDMVYLPISMGYRNCYKCYMDGLGYRVRSNAKGAVSVKEVGDQGKAFVLLQTYSVFGEGNIPTSRSAGRWRIFAHTVLLFQINTDFLPTTHIKAASPTEMMKMTRPQERW